MLEDLDLSSIADERARKLVQQLLNVLEDVMADLRAAQAENQRLRDELNRLKGEQGAPAIKANIMSARSRMFDGVDSSPASALNCFSASGMLSSLYAESPSNSRAENRHGLIPSVSAFKRRSISA